MNIPPQEGLFVDHHGRLHRPPSEEPPRQRRGIHVALLHEDHLLLVQPPEADWLEMPGGGLEEGESPAEALSRELSEEAGVRLPASVLRPSAELRLTSRYYSSNNQAYWLYDQIFYLIRLADPPPVGTPLEAGHVRLWTPLEKLSGVTLHHVHRLGLEGLLEQTCASRRS
ncbi:8-oxo-dGTP diphosphatase [Natronocella acetinitrilica]|uniref:8-oxo-dGTP diphosphatase n=1 Tax=Natronocella acetinitrilica TaxID=414046 RepID=A0AAE3G4Y3_9GAMM|nr:NUDIX domain-containing protein [Natronocella acetinitrilica]MCP1675940.1 8-oxo-dGTP diphosphatase [Natronocella acetinitrilica]